MKRGRKRTASRCEKCGHIIPRPRREMYPGTTFCSDRCEGKNPKVELTPLQRQQKEEMFLGFPSIDYSNL